MCVLQNIHSAMPHVLVMYNLLPYSIISMALFTQHVRVILVLCMHVEKTVNV